MCEDVIYQFGNFVMSIELTRLYLLIGQNREDPPPQPPVSA